MPDEVHPDEVEGKNIGAGKLGTCWGSTGPPALGPLVETLFKPRVG